MGITPEPQAARSLRRDSTGPGRQGLVWLVAFLLTCLTACAAPRPIAKIGLIAPFEGLYRRTGYAALAALRAALQDVPSTRFSLLPIALDDSGQAARAQRAAQKLLLDGQVRAVIGPLSPAGAATVAGVLSPGTMPWLSPFALDPAAGFVAPGETSRWADPLLAAVAAAARDQGATALLLAGSSTGWPDHTGAEWTVRLGMPVRMAGAQPSATPEDAVVWLGEPAEGAAWVNALRAGGSTVPFWVPGPQGEDPIWSEHAASTDGLYWATWLPAGYTDWAAAHQPSTPAAYLTYLATVQAVALIDGRPPLSGADWQIQLFAYDAQGVYESIQVAPGP